MISALFESGFSDSRSFMIQFAAAETLECRANPASREDLNRNTIRAIDDQIRPDWPEEYRVVGQVVATMSHSGRPCKSPKRVEESFDPPAGGINAVRGYVFPDLFQIEAGVNSKDVVIHPAGFRRSADFRRNRARTSAGVTNSPRSAAARRRLSSRLNSASRAARAESCSSSRRSASRTTSLAELYRPDPTLALMNFSSSGVSDTFMILNLPGYNRNCQFVLFDRSAVRVANAHFGAPSRSSA